MFEAVVGLNLLRDLLAVNMINQIIMKTYGIVPALVLGAVLLFSCEKPAGNTKPEEPVEQTLSLDLKELLIPIEGERTLTLDITPAADAGNVECSVTDEKVAELVSVVIDSEKGTIAYKLKGVGLGTATFLAVLGDKVEKCEIKVVPIAVEKIILDMETLELDVNSSYTLGATIEPENASNPVIDWSSDNNNVATVSRGTVTGVGEGSAVITAAIGSVKATCTVNVHIVEAESLTLDVTSREIVVGETFIVTAVVLPDDATYRTAVWSLDDEAVASYELIDAVEGDNVIAAKVTGLAVGKSVLKATCGKLTAECPITVVPKEEPVKDPAVGDYYYSDGSWSDGASAPLEGKTVIGIVFSTDQSRISDAEKALGYTHGLVMAAKTAHAPGEVTTRYSFDSDFDVVPNKKLGTSWFADINGYGWTKAILEAYPGDRIWRCPAFDWTTTDFSPSAPTGSSGWYIPSIGQLWTLLANLGGDEIAAYMRQLETYDSDISYYCREGELKLSYNPVEKLNSWLAQIPEADKELFVTTMDRGASGKVCDIMSSSLYDNTDGAVCIFWLYDAGQIEPVADWTDQMMICRPILSF